ncbi:methionyl-tRNA formyltransferase [Riemerella columbina]|uniref:methionyl-tRNA formyltransferase n=1 Tax=Riemerella columbina TaxID=103810 RepID=UPI00266FE162|nr:methionyl-tRNA formyltransferase [Riemerella columbina]WKS95725.1 methionyl-tRNA formyltransferase [Riemerella columbina]
MSQPLKVVFFGTPEFAQKSLEAIHCSRHQVVGVVTVMDKASGRGQKIQASPVKQYAEAEQLPILQPEKLRDPQFLEAVKAWDADIFVVVAFRMMPKILFQMPRLGTFNLHASLLPDYRGAAPINFAIINGETTTGVTTFYINEKIDEGNLLLQKSTPIGADEDAGSLHDRLMLIGADLVVETLDRIAENTITETPQPDVAVPKNAFKIFKEDTRINWRASGREIYNFIRGLSPYPAAFTTVNIGEEAKTLKIYRGHFEPTEHSRAVGTVERSKHQFKIFVKDGIYIPEEVQLQGKKRMPVKDFLNGFQEDTHISLA